MGETEELNRVREKAEALRSDVEVIKSRLETLDEEVDDMKKHIEAQGHTLVTSNLPELTRQLNVHTSELKSLTETRMRHAIGLTGLTKFFSSVFRVVEAVGIAIIIYLMTKG